MKNGLEDIVKGAKGDKNVQGPDKRYIGPDAEIVKFYVQECADTVYNNATNEKYFFQGELGRKVLTRLGANRIKDFKFSPLVIFFTTSSQISLSSFGIAFLICLKDLILLANPCSTTQEACFLPLLISVLTSSVASQELSVNYQSLPRLFFAYLSQEVQLVAQNAFLLHVPRLPCF